MGERVAAWGGASYHCQDPLSPFSPRSLSRAYQAFAACHRSDGRSKGKRCSAGKHRAQESERLSSATCCVCITDDSYWGRALPTVVLRLRLTKRVQWSAVNLIPPRPTPAKFFFTSCHAFVPHHPALLIENFFRDIDRRQQPPSDRELLL